MPRRLRPISREDELSVVDHLDELRRRLIVCAVALVAAFVVCFVGNSTLLNVLNAPLHHLDRAAKNELRGTTGDEVALRQHLQNASGYFSLYARDAPLPAPDRALIAAGADQLLASARSLPAYTTGVDPITLGISEPFTVTIRVCFYAALILSLPILLFEAFAFIIPALSERERVVIAPILIAAPALFLAGVVFAYVIVLPAAIKFLQGYNNSHFQTLIQAGSTYSFEVLTMGAIGTAFEMPVFLLGLRAAGVIDGSTLTRHWRYAAVVIAVVIAVVAAAMPGADPVTTGLETAPLVILFLASIVVLTVLDRRAARRRLNARGRHPADTL